MKNNKDKAITVTVAKRPGSVWKGGREAQLPSVRLGIDQGKVQSYPKVVVDGIDVYYVDSVATSFKTVRVKVEKLLFFKKLVAVSER